jgi:hypothetical protein
MSIEEHRNFHEDALLSAVIGERSWAWGHNVHKHAAIRVRFCTLLLP